ncbi:hypothetical protein AVEN_248851-1 [Araneus ventricosus]|uniref:Uncharacterized protein n=1 Tax=Araneus ventricosus TaxID=182803 RepID=A0A4Y2RJ50_ARAVE|nr:hypothetical protein AVEN_248851-1 [Araneus ventricosus]
MFRSWLFLFFIHLPRNCFPENLLDNVSESKHGDSKPASEQPANITEQFSTLQKYAKGEKYEEGMSIDEDIPVDATLTDLEICQAVCEQDQVLKVDDSDGDECFEENPPTNAEIRQALHILKRSFQHRSTNFEKRRVRTI